ncbi:MAG: Fic family protein [Chloroflexota bacterium]|nr:Fic family protein [Chloroflexota bacterium]
MAAELPDPFCYPGTRILRNRLGHQRDDWLEEAEAFAYSYRREFLPPRGFRPDMRGLKQIHEQLLGDVYEWAGYARHEPVIVDGQLVEPREHSMRKGEAEFASSEYSRLALPRELALRRDELEVLRDRGTLKASHWWGSTAEALSLINWAHPFREGNGRAMRHFATCSAEYCGFGCTLPRRREWMVASTMALRNNSAQPFGALLAKHTVPRPRVMADAIGRGAAVLRMLEGIARTVEESERKAALEHLAGVLRPARGPERGRSR